MTSNAKRSGESVRLALLSSVIGQKASGTGRVIVGVSEMDDAAVLTCPVREHLVAASDFVRGTEFYLHTLGYLSHRDLGYYLIAANLSDMAAMGCTPAGLLTVVRYSNAMTDAQFVDVFVGMQQASEDFGCPIVGGDIGGYKEDVFSASAFGFTRNQRFLTRRGASPGDSLYVSGAVGGAIAALTYCKEIKPLGAFLSEENEDAILSRWRRPSPRISLGQLLCDGEYATSCMDVSDGLKASLLTLSNASRVGILVDESAVPLDPVLNELARAASLNATALGMSASVDFELLFTVPRRKEASFTQACSAGGHVVTRIGDVVAADSPYCSFRRSDGTSEEIPGVAWDHQMNDHVLEILALAKRSDG